MLEGRGTLDHDRALIRLALAVTLQEIEQFDDSLALLADCKRVFRQYGDTRNMIVATFAHGVLLQRMKLFRQAREAYLLIVATTPDLDDEQLAALNLTIGLCSIELEEYGPAHDAFEYAATIYSELDQPINVLNVELGLGRLLIRSGDHTAGVAHLRPVRRQFLSHGLAEEAGIAGLEIIEGLIAQARYSAAESVARKVVSEFELAGLNRRAITALRLLTEILENKTASAENVRDIREYIVSLRTNPERDFRISA
jgi:tetratricopeptide (TPR) repeat protein